MPKDTTQRNFADPGSNVMLAPGGNCFIQAYNAQAVIDSAQPVIVTGEPTNQPSSKGQAEPMTEAANANTG
jgi:hypothetical protein